MTNRKYTCRSRPHPPIHVGKFMFCTCRLSKSIFQRSSPARQRSARILTSRGLPPLPRTYSVSNYASVRLVFFFRLLFLDFVTMPNRIASLRHIVTEQELSNILHWLRSRSSAPFSSLSFYLYCNSSLIIFRLQRRSVRLVRYAVLSPNHRRPRRTCSGR